MLSAIHTPLDFSEPVKAGRRRFWKQILPVTSIDYDGQKIDFDPNFHKSLELSYRAGVYDQIPIVFADGKNTHNEDPRNFGGEVIKMENRGKDGTWALIEADRQAAKAIENNPKLGVSARIMQGVEKGGKVFDHAVRHVLMTMFPRVTGMEPWQAVDLSEDADIEVVDLTAVSYEEGNPMGRSATKKVKRTAEGKIDLSALSDDEFMHLLDLAETLEDEDVDEDLDEDETEIEDTTTTPKKKKSKVKVTKVTEKESEGGDEDEDDPDAEDDPEDETTDLSDHVIKRSEVSQFQQMRIDLAESKWQDKRKEFLRAGVPPFMLDLADDVMKQPDPLVLDLSDDGGKKVNATKILNTILEKSRGLVDLSGEDGHMVDLSDDGGEDSDDAFLKAWDEQYG